MEGRPKHEKEWENTEKLEESRRLVHLMLQAIYPSSYMYIPFISLRRRSNMWRSSIRPKEKQAPGKIVEGEKSWSEDGSMKILINMTNTMNRVLNNDPLKESILERKIYSCKEKKDSQKKKSQKEKRNHGKKKGIMVRKEEMLDRKKKYIKKIKGIIERRDGSQTEGKEGITERKTRIMKRKKQRKK